MCTLFFISARWAALTHSHILYIPNRKLEVELTSFCLSHFFPILLTICLIISDDLQMQFQTTYLNSINNNNKSSSGLHHNTQICMVLIYICVFTCFKFLYFIMLVLYLLSKSANLLIHCFYLTVIHCWKLALQARQMNADIIRQFAF